MRDRVYIYFLVFLLLLTTIILFLFSYNYKIKYYHNINLIYISDNRYNVLVNDKEFDLIKNNRIIYISNNKYKYKIISYDKNILHRSNKYYHNIVISINKKNNYKNSDIIKGSIVSKRIRLIDIFNCIYR